jgi:UDP-glucose 4-epimerase
MKVLITGGAGFIGSSIASMLIDNGILPIILDDLSLGRLEFASRFPFYQGDIASKEIIDQIFLEHDIYAVIHCAARIAVPDSVADPLFYYQENVSKTILMIDHLIQNKCSRIIFSSSASIYKSNADFFVDENSPLEPVSPYARTKMVMELALEDVSRASDLKVIALRYFNPIGADPNLRTGLQISNPSHALGKMIQAYRENRTFFVTGVDWPTRDGTAIRDYVHVWDLARAHFESVVRFDQMFAANDQKTYQVINLGTGNGTTVRELVTAFSRVTGDQIKIEETARRPGDVVGVFTKSQRAFDLLGWRPQFTVEQGIRHSLEWDKVRNQVLVD